MLLERRRLEWIRGICDVYGYQSIIPGSQVNMIPWHVHFVYAVGSIERRRLGDVGKIGDIQDF